MDFKNKVVIVTGSSSGIGAETAYLFASFGAKVVVNYLNNEKGAEEVAKKISTITKDFLCIKADVSCEKDCERLVKNTLQKFGTIDILVNNVGVYYDNDEWDGELSSWSNTFSTNINSVLLMSKLVSQHFLANKKGKIVNVSSRLGLWGVYDAVAYSASKAAVLNITASYAKLLSPFGNCNCVSPGATYAGYWAKKASENELKDAENKNPHKKLVSPTDIANAILFLSSNLSDMITNQNILVDGGESSLTK